MRSEKAAVEAATVEVTKEVAIAEVAIAEVAIAEVAIAVAVRATVPLPLAHQGAKIEAKAFPNSSVRTSPISGVSKAVRV